MSSIPCRSDYIAYGYPRHICNFPRTMQLSHTITGLVGAPCGGDRGELPRGRIAGPSGEQ